MRTALRTLAVLAIAPTAVAADLDFWVGEGANAATMVIDWDESLDAGPALAWGYRWDGPARVEQMLREVLANDDRLFAKLSPPGPIGIAVYGLGYDRSGDGEFALDDGSPFDATGVVVSGPSDGALATDPADLYAEGWEFDGFWHNAIASDADPAWKTAPVGSADLVLNDGDRAGWVFTPYSNPDGSGRTLEDLLRSAPGPATPAPPRRLVGDFNADGLVDAADYTRWRDTRGTAAAVAGAGADADFSSTINVADRAAWHAAYGAVATPLTVPEPSPIGLLLPVLLPLIPTRERV